MIETLIMLHWITENGDEQVELFMGNEALVAQLADQYPNVNYFLLDVHITKGVRRHTHDLRDPCTNNCPGSIG